MATEEQKKARLLKLCNDIVFGFAKGMYELFGDSVLATVDTIGEDIIEEMEHEMGLEIHGEDEQTILTELERILVDEYGLAKSMKLQIKDHEVDVICEGCVFWHATKELMKENIPPLTCVPMMIAEAALHKRLGKKAHFVGITQDDDKRLCDIDFHIN
ncbi:MAG: hypothetical protein JW862_06745 [Anaerolineales bacterium]|nr:hypothetical protein [Anaerolineales bacterium]